MTFSKKKSKLIVIVVCDEFYLSLGDELQKLKDLQEKQTSAPQDTKPPRGKENWALCSPLFYCFGYNDLFFGRLVILINEGSTSFTSSQWVYLWNLCSRGSPIVQIRQNLAKSPLGCPQTWKTQQGKWGKIWPKKYWRTLQNMLEMYKIIPSKKLQTMLTIDQESKLKHKLS